MSIKSISIIFVFTFLFSCASDKQEDLEEVPCVTLFTYTDCIKEIIANNCVICHNSSVDAIGPFPLETYAQVKDKAQNSELLERIQRADGSDGIMPQTGKMPQAKIDAILNWANSGYEE